MKVFVVLLSVTTLALASLEPAGYQPPGQHHHHHQHQSSSSSATQYLPPHLQHQEQHHHLHHQPAPSSPPAVASFQYLPPSSYDRPASPSRPQSQYLPPRPQQSAPAPSTNYLPAAQKPQLSAIPANDYLPPTPRPQPTPTNDYLPPRPKPVTSAPPPLPVNEYLPPSTAAPAPANDYLPPSRPVTQAPPANDYLPPRQPAPSAPAPRPIANDYLPPAREPSASAVVPPKGDYLPPRQGAPARLAPTTPVPRISVVSVSPYKLDSSAYSKPRQQQQPKYTGSGLATSATSSPARSRGYSGSGYSSGAQSFGESSYEQPSDNYLPPVVPAASGSYSAADSGYQYGAASRASVEQSTEPAKYDFEYRVSDEFGNDYSHKETREGAQTQGFYSVLLPDGRKQIVHYEANEDGFRPRITYEEAATVLSKSAGGADLGFAGYGASANSLDGQHGPY